ncbi:type I polyketide synthase, partial [Sciscionella sediminilitoris]|uniref:type I polyketide synthase n=1 Tax=Sciscionella sediminilitoris TaxID=1445613 RepID=UPI000568D721
ILEQPPEERPKPAPRATEPLTFRLSAHDDTALRTLARRIAPLAGDPADRPAIAATLAHRRAALPRRAVVLGDPAAGLAALAAGESTDPVLSGTAQPGGTALVFGGQGSQRLGMGRELCAESAVFAEAFEQACAALESHVDGSLRDVAWGADAEALADTGWAQPALFAFHLAAYHLARSWGLAPEVLLGHSVGEIAAAQISGALSLADAARLVTARAQAMARLPRGGAMVAVSGDPEQLTRMLGGLPEGVGVAARNSATSVVLSGASEAVESAVAGAGLRKTWLRTSHAFHSPLMAPAAEELAAVVAELDWSAPRIPVVSTVTGRELGPRDWADPGYWARQLTEPVRFAEAVSEAIAQYDPARWLELSPLASLTGHILGDHPESTAVSLGHREFGEPEAARRAAGKLWVSGAELPQAPGIPEDTGPIALPGYPFTHRRYWPEPTEVSGSAVDGTAPRILEHRWEIAWRPTEPALGAPRNQWIALTRESEPSGLAGEVLRALTEAGAEVRTLPVDGADPAALARRISELRGASEPGGLVSLLGLEDEPALPDTLNIVRALAELDEPPLWCLTKNAVATRPSDPAPAPESAALWGFGRVAALEQPARWGGLLDLPADPDAETLHRAVSLLAGNGAEDQLGLRRGGTFGRRLRRAQHGPKGPLWTPRGTVLITGGTGGIGAWIARCAAQNGAAELVLASRRGPEAPGIEALIAELAAHGTRVRAVAVDLADRAAVAELLDGTEELRAVVHAAGLGEARTITDSAPSTMAPVLAAKAHGAAILDELTAGRELDAFLLISSVAGVWGSAGQPAYAAANAYLDALAANRRARGLPATSVAWGPWRDTGLTEADGAVDRLARQGLRAFEPEEAAAALAALAGGADPAPVLADVELARFTDAFTLNRHSALLGELAPARQQAAEPGAPLADVPPERRSAVLLELVRTRAAAVLGLSEAPGSRAVFRDLGFDSLTAVELRNTLAGETGLDLPAALVFDHPSPIELAKYLESRVSSDAASAPAAATVTGSTAPLAIVGMACRFPGGVTDPDGLWDLVDSGAEGIGELPADRGWDPASLPAVRGGFLPDAAEFDAPFFGVAPREAAALDPQQRLVLETAWEAVERAGVDPNALRGNRIGVYIGASASGYGAGLSEAPEELAGQLLTGTASSVIAGRVSYTLGLRGPSLTVDTACSSSLVALHLAAGAIRAGECESALVGGVTVMASPAGFVEFERQGGLSADGRCKSFGAAADGTGWSEGVGVLLVQPLDTALAQGRRVLAVLRGSSVNADGASNGLTAPNGPAQEEVLRAALADAGLRPDEVDAVEAHGTGTVLGDPIEAEALQSVYGSGRAEPLWLGSLKSNIGHTQAASGIGGVIKMVQALRHERLPATLHADPASPHVDWNRGLALLTEARPWPHGTRPRRAGVSAFGVSGTNAHVVLESAAPEPDDEREPVDAGPLPWPFAGRTRAGREATATAYAARLPESPHRPVDLAFSLATTRAAHEHRGVVLAADAATAAEAFAAAAAGTEHPGLLLGEPTSGATAMLFSGQGSQRLGMGRELLETSPVFAEAFAQVCELLDPELDRPLREVVFGTDAELLANTGWAQPAIFAIEIALAAHARAHGIEPDVVLGHSIGALAAAQVAGVFELPDACRLVAARARAMRRLPEGGAMLAVRATPQEAAEWLRGAESSLAIAAVNGPRSVIVSGAAEAVERIRLLATEQGIRATPLRVSHAFHSPLMDPAMAEVAEALATVTLHEPRIPMVCDRRGRLAEPGELTDPAHWVAQLREPVRFADAVRACREFGVTRWLEVGPDATLTPLLPEIPEVTGPAVPMLRRDQSETGAVLRAVATLYVSGADVDWHPAFAGYRPRVVDVPVTPLRRKRYWLGPGNSSPGNSPGSAAGTDTGHPLLPRMTNLAGGGTVLSGRLDPEADSWLTEHRISGAMVLPTAAYLELFLAAGETLGCLRVAEAVIEAPLSLDGNRAAEIQIEAGSADLSGFREVAFYSRAGDGSPWQRHARGRLATAECAPAAVPEIAEITRTEDEIAATYERWSAEGTGYGTSFRAVRRIGRAGELVVAELALPEDDRTMADAQRFGMHPALLDAVLQALAMSSADAEPFLVFTAAELSLHAVGATRLRVAIEPGQGQSVSVHAVDPAGDPVLTIGTLGLRPASAAAEPPRQGTEPKATGTGRARRRAASTTAPEAKTEPEAKTGPESRWSGRAGAEVTAELLALIRARTATVLGLETAEDVSATRAFTELGVSSIGAVELRDGLERDTGARLPATLVFDHPNPEALATVLCALLTETAGPEHTQTAHRAGLAEDPIVIVGTACRYPGGVGTPEGLWDVVAGGVDAIGPMPADRGWDLDALYHPDPDHEGTCYTREGGFLREAGEFDAAFFGISPREALAMDPQQRLLLETSWEAIERAGIDPGALRGSATGVFAGITYQDYSGLLARAVEDVEGYIGTGTSPSVLSGRVAYLLGLEGPALSVDTACSSSLVALHLAVRALRDGECELALAGGATVMASPGSLIEFSRQRALAEDGRCKPFAAAADGASWGEGVGVVLLERLSDARRNGHRVLATVAGSALNSDGASNGLTAPNGPAQQRVIRAALASAGLRPEDVDAVEAHGTGTTLGDPIEAQALIAVYGRDRDPERPLWLGSLKSNIGHSQAAAGVGGVIKMVEALRNGSLPRTLHLDEPSPHVDWSGGGVALLGEEVAWPAGERVRRAGVSAFGMSGTNAHVILEEAPAEQDSADRADPGVPVLSEGPVAWTFSARSAEALATLAGRLAPLARSGADPAGVAAVLATRPGGTHRAAVLLDEQAGQRLSAFAATPEAPLDGLVRNLAGETARPVFVFPGQGAQWIGMGARLFDCSPVFRERLTECAAALAEVSDVDVVDVLRDKRDLEHVDVVQPVSWAVMVALAAVWRAAGVTPAVVLGHSQGEIAAAVVAGVLSVRDGARVVAGRARLLRAIAGDGGMGSIALPVDQVRERIESAGLAVAAVNGPRTTVVSGPAAPLDELLAALSAEGVRTKRIAVDYASHSAAMDALRADLLAALDTVEPAVGTVDGIRWFSTVHGDWMTPEHADAGYWFANLRAPVGFHPAVESLLSQGFRAMIEVGPHPVLLPSIAEAAEAAGLPETGAGAVTTVATLRREADSPEQLRTVFAQAWAAGVAVDPAAFGAARAGTVHPSAVPTTPFARRHYWPELAAEQAVGGETDAAWAAPLWDGIERSDVDGLATELALAPSTPFSEVVPALAAWRDRRKQGSEIEGWRYRADWKPLPEPSTVEFGGTWLVVRIEGEPDPDAGRIPAALREAGATVLELEIAPEGREAIAGVLATQPRLTGVLALTGLAAGTPAAHDPEHPATPRGLTATLNLVQALGDAGVDAPLWTLTRGAVSVGPSNPLEHPEPALLWGFGRVAALEHADRWGGLLDLPAGGFDDRAARRLCAILAGAGDLAGEDQLALRGSGVFGRRLARNPHAGEPVRRWRPRGTVLVTGGTGALGGHLARWLAEGGAEHLVLTSRRGPDAPGAAALARELESRGVRVTVAACDVADRDSLGALLAEIDAGPLPLRAVVHAAGTLDDGVVESLTADRLEPVLRAKAGAAAVLDELTRGRDLDAFVLFSSTSGTIGGPGLGNYAPGNAFLDALATIRRNSGDTATAVAWGHWGGEGGMGQGAVGERLRRFGVLDMAPETALRALGEILDHDETTVSVTSLDWDLFAPAFTAGRSSALLADLPEAVAVLAAAADAAGDAGKPLLFRHLEEIPRADWKRELGTVVRTYAAAVLGHAGPEVVAEDAAFRDLGCDSLTAVELRNALGKAVGMRLPATLVFDYPTPVALAEYLYEQIAATAGEPAAVADSTPARTADPGEPIAVVGMGCRFPGGVRDPEGLWELLSEGVDAIGPMPADRGWDLKALYDPDPDQRDTSYAAEGGFLDAAGEFDAGFFGISPREALAMDPQQRLLLETSWEALERSGIDPGGLRGSATGVFVGTNGQDYTGLLVASGEDVGGYIGTGNAASVVSGRVAYSLGLEGPAVTVDTACSASLVALHQAAAALRSGECDLALAGGVTVMATPSLFQEFSRQRGLAPDGRCKPFADAADGAGFSEGVGMLVLARLSEAEASGRPVLAVLRGSAVNSDGASNGLTAPNGPSQQRVIRSALAVSGLSTADV